MVDIKEILKDCFHAGRRFESGNFQQQTFEEWYDSYDAENKVKNLAQPYVSRQLQTLDDDYIPMDDDYYNADDPREFGL